MTDKINEYMKLVNMPRSASIEEEMELMNNIRTFLSDGHKLKKMEITRYVRDTGSKMTVIYETRRGDDSETAFILSELQKVYPNDIVFASPNMRYVIDD